MPIYEYRCEGCGQVIEKFQKMSDETVTECPECGAEARRQISGGAGFLFKGDGFYTTDYRSDSYKKEAKKDKESSKPASESKSTKPDGSSSAKKPTQKKGKKAD